jgi:hypothetical protein
LGSEGLKTAYECLKIIYNGVDLPKSEAITTNGNRITLVACDGMMMRKAHFKKCEINPVY